MRGAWLPVTLALVACSAPGTNDGDRPGEGVVLPDGTVFTRASLLSAQASCIAASSDEFLAKAQALESATLAATTDTSARASAQAAWREVMQTWQRLELMQVGPAAKNAQPGGQDLRDNIYGWPLFNRCGIDENLVNEQYDLSSALVNRKGLEAVEYALFSNDAQHGCGAEHAISAAWAGLSEEALASRRALYAHGAAEDITRHAQELAGAWAAEDGNFIAALSQAGQGSRIYLRDSLALNAVSDALFYLEWATKDNKVAQPAGLTRCETTTCPEALESSCARQAKENIRKNLVGFQQVFKGCGDEAVGLGFDDFLYAVGSPELGASLDTAWTESLAALDAIESDDLTVTLAENRDAMVALHTKLKGMTDLLRTQFVSVLDLEIPKRIEGDND